MKAHMRRMEKSFAFWFLVVMSLSFFFLRLPSLFEPYWYGDEGIYQTIALALTKGHTLYAQIWDNKPPLLYYTYATLGGNQFALRFLSLSVGVTTVIMFFWLAVRLFQEKNAAIISTIMFTVLFGIPTFEGNIANAENFMLLFAIAAGYLVYLATEKAERQKHLLLAGTFLGIAFLYKIVGIFDFAAFLVFFLIASLPSVISLNSLSRALHASWKHLTFIIGGFLFPFLLSLLYFLFNGALGDYMKATFLSTFGYVGHNNVFLIPQGLLIAKLLLLLGVVTGVLIKRKTLPKPIIFILLWAAFSLFNSYFSQRPYTHYLLVLVPSFSLVVGLLFYSKTRYKYLLAGALVITSILLLSFFSHWSLTKTVGYYTNFVSFLTGQKSLQTYESFFDRRTPRDSKVVNFIRDNSIGEPSMFMWGNTAQLYYQTGTLPPTRFTVAYHMRGNMQYEEEVAKSLQKNPPQFIVITDDMSSFPFSLSNYSHSLTIDGVDIYERTY